MVDFAAIYLKIKNEFQSVYKVWIDECVIYHIVNLFC